MKVLRLFAFTLLVLLWGALSADAVITKTFTLLSNITANEPTGTPLGTSSYTTGVIQVTGSFDATINILWSVDGTTYDLLECVSLSDRNTRGTTMIASGGMRCNLIGINHLKLTVTNYISGTINAEVGLAAAGVF